MQKDKKLILPVILEKDCWKTPPHILKQIYERFGLNGYMFDPCPPDPKINGLLIDWEKYTYVNPPYSEPEQPCKPNCKKKICSQRGFCLDEYRPGQIDWIKKSIEQSKKGCNVFMLIPSDTSTVIWNDYVMKYASKIYFVKGRIKFVGAKGMPKFGNALVQFGGVNKVFDVNGVYTETIKFKKEIKKSKLDLFV